MSTLSSPLLYQVLLTDLPGHRLTIRLTIPQPAPDGQQLRLPAWIPGSYLIRDFARQIETLQATANGQVLPVSKLDKQTWEIAPHAGPIEVEYVVYAWDLSVRAAHVDETHAFLNGTSTFLEVLGQADRICELELLAPDAHSPAANWTVHTSLPEAQGHPRQAARRGFGVYRAPNYDALIDHPIEMGTPQWVCFDACGAEHELVFTGKIPNLDLERVRRDVQRLCEAQIRFFEPETARAPFLDSSDRYVFMTMVTGDGYGGLEHRASTALMCARHDLPVIGQDTLSDGYQNFLGLVSHEYFHTWNVKRIKPAAFAPYQLDQESRTRLLWVFEGFTSYYDDLFLLRAGLIDEAQYGKILCKTIGNVHQGPGRFKQSVADSSFDTWTRFYKQDENSPNALVSYYSKGSLVALGLDLLIRQKSAQRHSLDTVMRALWQRHGRDFYLGRAQGIAEDAMPALILETTGVDAADFIARHAEGIEDVPLQTLWANAGYTLSWKTASELPDLGVRVQKQEPSLRLATVYEGGPAHRAGLSALDTVVALDGLRVTASNWDSLLGRYRGGETVEIHVFRRDELRRFTLQLAPPALSVCELRPASEAARFPLTSVSVSAPAESAIHSL